MKKWLALPTVALALAGMFAVAPPSHAAPPQQVPGLIEAGLHSTEGAKAAQAKREAKEATVSGYYTLSVATQRQATNYWCAPASGRVALSALMTYYPSQSTLASRMGTTTSGTPINNIAPALNSFQSRNYYVTSTGLSLSAYRDRVRWDMTTYRAPSVNAVYMQRLPWYAGKGIYGGHATSTYGIYESGTTYNHYVYDPWDNVRHYTTSSAMHYASMNGTLIW